MTQQSKMLNLFLSLLEQLESTPNGIVSLAPERLSIADPSAVQALKKSGLIQESQPLANIMCDGCDRYCIMPVHVRNDGKTPKAFIVCDKRDDIGRVPVDFSRMQMQVFTLAGIAAWLAKTLPTDRTPQEIEAGNIFQIGVARIKSKRHDIFLCRNLQEHSAITNANAPVIIAINGIAVYRKHPLVVAASLIYFENSQPCIDRNFLQQTLQRHNSSDEIAWEIELVNSEIILINHVTGSRIPITKTDFDSNNDNAFEFLFANAGKTLTENQVITGAEIDKLNLQKFVDQLHFKGNLRKLFFRVSKNAICFNRTVTFRQLHALGISPENPV